ncbi:MAG TPA: thioesterase family protein [Flavisolibacter sp.]|jgi:YbgC/YbaW family acyl-CoA thioester hydrolase
MARIKVSLPSRFSFSTHIPIRITDINYGNHVGNDSILSILHEARMQYLQNIGYTELAFAGIGLIMSDVAIEFKSEAFYGERLKAYVTVGEISKVGFELYYKLVKGEEETLVAVAKTGMICFDYQRKKVVAVPQEAVEKLSGL